MLPAWCRAWRCGGCPSCWCIAPTAWCCRRPWRHSGSSSRCPTLRATFRGLRALIGSLGRRSTSAMVARHWPDMQCHCQPRHLTALATIGRAPINSEVPTFTAITRDGRRCAPAPVGALAACTPQCAAGAGLAAAPAHSHTVAQPISALQAARGGLQRLRRPAARHAASCGRRLVQPRVSGGRQQGQPDQGLPAHLSGGGGGGAGTLRRSRGPGGQHRGLTTVGGRCGWLLPAAPAALHGAAQAAGCPSHPAICSNGRRSVGTASTWSLERLQALAEEVTVAFYAQLEVRCSGGSVQRGGLQPLLSLLRSIQ